MRVLLTGMSGAGKSSLVRELRRRGFVAYDADEDGYAEAGVDGVWRWRVGEVSELLDGSKSQPLFFAGCAEEQALFPWDLKVLLTAPASVLLERLTTRSTNSYGKRVEERERILADLRDVEPLIRGSADLVIETTQPLARVADRVVLAATHAGSS